jgi:hypothetical protein
MAAHSPTDIVTIQPVQPDQPQTAWPSWLREIAARVNEIGSRTTELAAGGATGPAGPPGPTGPAGPAGATGPAGSANITGAVAGQLTIAGSATSITSSVPTSTFLTPTAADAAYVNVSGDTMTGALGINTTPTGADLVVNGGAFFSTGAGAGDAVIEIGQARSASGNAYIDLHAASGTDYELRILRSSGVNGAVSIINSGTGTFTFYNASGVVSAQQITGTNNGSYGAVRMVGPTAGTGYGSFFFNDGSSTHLLLTANNDPNGVLNSLRPLQCVESTGDLALGHSVMIGAPSGGQKGNGTLNAQGVYANNVLLTSDATVKREIEPPPPCLPLVAAVEPKSFRWAVPDPVPLRSIDNEPMTPAELGPPGFYTQENLGFLAQDLAGSAVHRATADGTESVDLGGLVAVLWQAVRELSARVEAMEAR